MAELDNLLGCRISILTMADVRYEGVLFSINARESSVVLRDVSLITDSGPAPPESFVSFPGNEIKDLCVHDVTPEIENEIQSLPTPIPPTPPAPAEVLPPVPPATNNTNRSGNTQNKQHNTSRGSNNRYQSNSSNQNNRGSRGGNPMPAAGTGEHLLKLRVRQVHGGAKDENQVINGEFDFETSLGSFNKEEIMTEAAVPTAIKTYEKDDFFDNLSCDTLDRQEGKSSRITFGEERKLNQDTFGAIALHNNNYRHNYNRNTGGGGRSDGRGGGGRGSGRGYRGGNSGNSSWRGGRGRGRGRSGPPTTSS